MLVVSAPFISHAQVQQPCTVLHVLNVLKQIASLLQGLHALRYATR